MSIKIAGMKELRRNLDQLPKEMQGRALQTMLTAGGQVIAKKAKTLISHEESGALKKSLGTVFRKGKKGYAVIGARNGFATIYKGKRRNPANYAHLVERGHSGGKVPAYPFLRPAIDSTGSEVLTEMANGMTKAIDKAVRKFKTKGKF